MTVTGETAGFGVLDHPSWQDHEQIVFCGDRASGLRAIIAVHDTTLGPALGGCRMWNYPTEAAALDDALRLSRGMTYKNALADLPLGGGKTVVIGDPRRDKSAALFEALGTAVERLGGRYITAEDVGITDRDVECIGRRTAHVRGTRATGLGDPSPFTAYGVFCALRAAFGYRNGGRDLAGIHVAVQGVGHVGRGLCALLAAAGARLTVADIDAGATAEVAAAFGARVVGVEEIHAVAADVFAPCALGGALNAETIPALRAALVCGAANNQLREAADGQALMRRGIDYVPDYLANAGGVISIALARPGTTASQMNQRLERIGDTVRRILARAEADRLPPGMVADRIAEERLAAARSAAAASA